MCKSLPAHDLDLLCNRQTSKHYSAPTTVVKSVFRCDSKIETVGQVSIQWLTRDSSIPLPGSFITITRVKEFLNCYICDTVKAEINLV